MHLIIHLYEKEENTDEKITDKCIPRQPFLFTVSKHNNLSKNIRNLIFVYFFSAEDRSFSSFEFVTK